MNEINMGPWARFFAAEWKPHWVPSALLEDITADARARFHEFLDAEPATEGGVDQPGMIMADRTYQTLEIDGFKLTIPSQDWEYFLRELEYGRRRKFASGTEYYKIHGWLNCVVFTVDQRDRVLAEMKARLPAIKIVAQKEDQEFLRRIREINSDGVKVVTPKDPQSLEGVVEKRLVSKPNGEKN
jgi:hypothetical protein